MFGYVKPRHGDLRVREYDFYRAAYCGVCRRMKATTGAVSTCSLSYDFVFLALCRMLLTDGRVVCRKCRCAAHPCRGKMCLSENEALDITARTAAVLSYEKLLDDRQDERGMKRFRARLALPFFRRAVKRARVPALSLKVRELLSELSALETARTPSVDAPSDVFGQVLGEIFAFETETEMRECFYRVGYHLGRFIYAADAVEDEPEDRKTGSYNPYVLLYPEGMTDGALASVHTGLYLTLDALGNAVEELPYGDKHAVKEIIANIVYAGLPDRVECIFRERGLSQKDKKRRKKPKESRI